jgi:hypothetical protein
VLGSADVFGIGERRFAKIIFFGTRGSGCRRKSGKQPAKRSVHRDQTLPASWEVAETPPPATTGRAEMTTGSLIIILEATAGRPVLWRRKSGRAEWNMT